MMATVDSLFLFLFCLMEIGCYYYFLSPLEKRNNQLWYNLLMVLLFTVCLFVLTNPFVRYIYDYLYLIVYYLLIWGFILLITEVELKESLYYLMVILLATRFIKHIVGHISIIQYKQNFLVEGNDWYLRAIYFVLILLLYYGILSFIKKYVFKNDKRYLSYYQLVWMGSLIVPQIFCSDLVSKVLRNMPNNISWLSLSPLVTEAICGICGLIVVIISEHILALQAKEKERLQLETMLKTQHKQYLIKKETLDLVNQKYHDLKNHILYLQSASDHNLQEYINNLQNEIKIYETIHQTGNETLDIIIMDKHLKCQRKNIRLLLFIDGKQLSFMSPIDIVTIFGNALDNAIESVDKIENPEKKEIIVKQFRDKNWLLIRFENYYSHKLRWSAGNLETTKENKEEHGFGLKSIRYVVNKYHGNMTILTEKDRFILNILFPCE